MDGLEIKVSVEVTIMNDGEREKPRSINHSMVVSKKVPMEMIPFIARGMVSNFLLEGHFHGLLMKRHFDEIII